jgi:hypothetical protein
MNWKFCSKEKTGIENRKQGLNLGFDLLGKGTENFWPLQYIKLIFRPVLRIVYDVI